MKDWDPRNIFVIAEEGALETSQGFKSSPMNTLERLA